MRVGVGHALITSTLVLVFLGLLEDGKLSLLLEEEIPDHFEV